VNLDDDLRRMLADLDTDERLDVPVRAGAAEVIVSGARRLRRKRIAAVTAASALTAAAVVVGGFVLVAGGPEALPPATSDLQVVPESSVPSASSASTSSATSPGRASSAGTRPGGQVPGPGGGGEGNGGEGGGNQQPSVDPPPPPSGTQIGPASFRALRLGMTYDEAAATGMVGAGDPVPATGCATYPLLVDGQPVGDVRISAAAGIEVLYPVVALHTPEGASNGWSVAQVKAVYPEIDEAAVADSGLAFPAVPGNPGAVYRLEFLDELVGIGLQSSAQPCGG
jgi:hypothetical protein